MTRSTKIMTVCFVQVLGLLALCRPAYAVEGMVSYWRFDEGSGTTASDSIGSNDGTIYGATWTTGIVNSALSFDGVDDYVDLGSVNINIPGDFTITAWIKAIQSRSNYRVILSKGPKNTGHYEIYLNISTGELKFYSNDIGDIGSGRIVDDNIWHHITVTYNGANMKFYVDGNLESSPSASGSITSENEIFYIGRQIIDLSMPFNGLIDEVAIYNRALTDEEIWQLYQNAVDSRTIAINNTRRAILEKIEALERIDVALGREWLAYAALEELLASGDYGDLNKADIIRAKQDIFAAIQQQEQSKNAIEQSLEKLEAALLLLGYELEP
ncbi:MAG: LamG domain-containing protein [Planctomycetota bacterium]